jgi:hypothetical protein
MGTVDDMIKEFRRHNKISPAAALMASLTASICFGLWQESWYAGIFLHFCASWASNRWP